MDSQIGGLEEELGAYRRLCMSAVSGRCVRVCLLIARQMQVLYCCVFNVFCVYVYANFLFTVVCMRAF